MIKNFNPSRSYYILVFIPGGCYYVIGLKRDDFKLCTLVGFIIRFHSLPP